HDITRTVYAEESNIDGLCISNVSKRHSYSGSADSNHPAIGNSAASYLAYPRGDLCLRISGYTYRGGKSNDQLIIISRATRARFDPRPVSGRSTSNVPAAPCVL